MGRADDVYFHHDLWHKQKQNEDGMMVEMMTRRLRRAGGARSRWTSSSNAPPKSDARFKPKASGSPYKSVHFVPRL
eukprot:1964949-Rhodomonas_salina.1